MRNNNSDIEIAQECILFLRPCRTVSGLLNLCQLINLFCREIWARARTYTREKSKSIPTVLPFYSKL